MERTKPIQIKNSKYSYCLVFALISLGAAGQIQWLRPYTRVVYQRNAQNQATIPVAAKAPDSSLAVTCSLVNQDTQVVFEQKPAVIDGLFFQTEFTAPVGTYKLTCLCQKANRQTVSGTIVDVSVGDVFLVAGQSNITGPGPFSVSPKVTGVYYDLTNSYPGTYINLTQQIGIEKWIYPAGAQRSFMGVLGDEWVNNTGVPISFLAAGRGGTTIESWLTDMPIADSPYGHIRTALKTFLKETGVKAVLMQHGESNAVDKITAQTNYENALKQLIMSSRSELPFDVPWVIAQVSWSKTGDGSSNKEEFRTTIRNAQKTVGTTFPNCFLGPDTDQITGYEGSINRPDGVHFSLEGQTQVGKLWADKLKTLALNPMTSRSKIYSKQSQNIVFPQIKFAYDFPENFDLTSFTSAGLSIKCNILSGDASIKNNVLTVNSLTQPLVLQAYHLGNDFYQATEEIKEFRLLKKIQPLSIEPVVSQNYSGLPIEVKFKTSSANPLNFKILNGVGVFENGTLKNYQPGVFKLEISQKETLDYYPSSKTVSFQIYKNPQSINFSEVPDSYAFKNSEIKIQASSTANLPISVKVKSGPAVAGNGLSIKLTGEVGPVVLELNQPGNEYFLPATPQTLRFNTLAILGLDSEEPPVVLYPNPTSNLLQIRLDFEATSIKIFNALGQEQTIEKLDSFANVLTFSTASLPNGIYFLKLQDSTNQTFTHKFVVQK